MAHFICDCAHFWNIAPGIVYHLLGVCSKVQVDAFKIAGNKYLLYIIHIVHVVNMKFVITLNVCRQFKELDHWATFVNVPFFSQEQTYTKKYTVCSPMWLLYGFIYFIFPTVSAKQMLFEVEKLLLWYWNMSTEPSQVVKVLFRGKITHLSIWVCKNNNAGF